MGSNAREQLQHQPDRSPVPNPHESDPRLVLHYGDLTDSTNLIRIIQQVQPDEIYNLGAQSHVAVSLRAGVHSE